MIDVHQKMFAFINVLLLSAGICSYAQPSTTIDGGMPLQAHTDFLYIVNKHFFQDFYVQSPVRQEAVFSVDCYHYIPGEDSVLLYQYVSPRIMVNRGDRRVKLDFQQGNFRIDPAYAQVIKRTGIIPPAAYKLYVRIEGDSSRFEQLFLHEPDSLLPVTSAIRKGIIHTMSPAREQFLGQPKPAPAFLDRVGVVFERSGPRVARYLRKKGMVPRYRQQDGKEVMDVYFDTWFMGRLAMDTLSSFSGQLREAQNTIGQHIGAFTSNQLGSYASLLSQFRELKKESKDNKELTGELAVAGNFSNDQEVASEWDNNFYEVRGMLELPILTIPVTISGFYTTQDRNREAKASYLHFRYDVQKAKEQLLQLVGSYNRSYEQALAQGANYNMIYGQFISRLEQEKEQVMASLMAETGWSTFGPESLSATQLEGKANELLQHAADDVSDSLRNMAGSTADKARVQLAEAEEVKAKAQALYARAMERYEQVKELERKAEKYRKLLSQYQSTLYYDSLFAFDKMKDMEDLDAMSYKDLAKKASNILPDGKVKGIMTGLTNLEAGMFPKYISAYTMSGQVLKGADVGYDIGVAEIGASYGKTEFIDRHGKVEAYKAYSGRVQFKPLLHQRIGLVYYGYSPGRQLLSDNTFFKDTDVSLPSFRNPVHIFSGTYSGKISRYLNLSGEFAHSNKQGQSDAGRSALGFKEQSAYNFGIEGTVPRTEIDIEAAYEFAGKAFENNTLPVMLSGTERFHVGGKGRFFRSFLSVGLSYHYLIQSSFQSTGNQAKWGFELATHSKRYPSVALSYKPFSTFRSFNDTLNIEQKPILGEVWTGRANYQIKKKDRALRFALIYNRNNSSMEAVRYSSNLLQWSTIYTYRTTMLMLNIGRSEIHTDYIETLYPVFDKSSFAQVSAGGNVLPNLNISGGLDGAVNKAGLCRYGVQLGSVYSFKKMPLLLRGNFRYSNYRMEATGGWQPIYTGGLEIAWRFRMKLKE